MARRLGTNDGRIETWKAKSMARRFFTARIDQRRIAAKSMARRLRTSRTDRSIGNGNTWRGRQRTDHGKEILVLPRGRIEAGVALLAERKPLIHVDDQRGNGMARRLDFREDGAKSTARMVRIEDGSKMSPYVDGKSMARRLGTTRTDLRILKSSTKTA